MRERTIDGMAFCLTECITCGVTYSVPKNLWDKQQRDGGFHHCCNGHSQGWSKNDSETERLRRERDRLAQRVAEKDDEIAAKARELESERKKARRVAKRAAAGVCQCCNRTFNNMALHMKHMHPDFTADQKPALKVVA